MFFCFLPRMEFNSKMEKTERGNRIVLGVTQEESVGDSS